MDPAVPPEHMALLPDGEQPRARSRGRLAPGCRQTVVILLALIVLVLPLALYERENNLPNPFWGLLNGTYTYTPDKGPPGADLLNSRPDEALLAYINDYLKVARTYPCTENIQQWRGLDISDDDPVEAGHGCTVVRPVERIAIVSVRIDRLGILKGPAAFVTYSIMYVSGEKR